MDSSHKKRATLNKSKKSLHATSAKILVNTKPADDLKISAKGGNGMPAKDKKKIKADKFRGNLKKIKNTEPASDSSSGIPVKKKPHYKKEIKKLQLELVSFISILQP